jgi:hypothetical protein
MAKSRISPPLHLPGATEFSAQRDQLSTLWLVKTLKETDWLYDDLAARTTVDKEWGRRREPGSWALAYMGFVVSKFVDIEPWWVQTATELWRECGFLNGRPAYQTVYERFVELEAFSDEFREVAGRLIRYCKEQAPEIGKHLHVDGTEAETHSALAHDCQPGEGCKWHKSNGSQRGTPTATHPRRVPTEVVRDERHSQSNQPPLPDDEQLAGQGELKEVDGRLRLRMNGHWFRTLDNDAGVRAYSGPRKSSRFWHGFYNHKMIDHYTGAPLAVGVYSASLQEHLAYPDLLNRAQGALGTLPQTVTADRGFSIEKVFERNTRLGVASVIPWRKGLHRMEREDFTTHDRHGIPRCKHCAGESEFVRFSETPSARIWFHCLRPKQAGCQKDQTIACSTDWRLLVPLWRVEPVYHELRQSHQSYERVHRLWRERYRVGGDNRSSRPKRRGRACQELRAQAALLAEWFTIAWREGWLESSRKNHKEPKRNKRGGERAAKELESYRFNIGLTTPYGPMADARRRLPPSLRKRKKPPRPPDWGDVPF